MPDENNQNQMFDLVHSFADNTLDYLVLFLPMLIVFKLYARYCNQLVVFRELNKIK